MKKIVLLTVVLFSFKSMAWFNMNAQCYLQSGVQANCEVCNFDYYRPIFCQVSMRGISIRGFFNMGQIRNIVRPGQCISGSVFARNPYIDPLMSAQANARCRF